MLFSLLLLAAQAPSSAPQATTEAARQTIGAAIGQILQADGPKARSLLGEVPKTQLAPKDADFVTCADKRLSSLPEAQTVMSPVGHQPDAFASEVLQAYRIYWQESVAGAGARAEADQRLLSTLSTLLGKTNAASVAELEPALAAALEGRGFHSLEGQTGLLHELMLWTSETKRVEHVKLPEATNATPTYYLDGFVSQGWSSYLACDRTGTGGWTNEKGLFVVVPGYKSLTDENFRVNFLAHESQHFADNKRFPGLKPWELEYRAKLVELAYAVETSAKIIERFRDSEGDNPEDAHSYANKQVIETLRKRLNVQPAQLTSLPIPKIQRAALGALRADSAMRSTHSRAAAQGGHLRIARSASRTNDGHKARR